MREMKNSWRERVRKRSRVRVRDTSFDILMYMFMSYFFQKNCRVGSSKIRTGIDLLLDAAFHGSNCKVGCESKSRWECDEGIDKVSGFSLFPLSLCSFMPSKVWINIWFMIGITAQQYNFLSSSRQHIEKGMPSKNDLLTSFREFLSE